LVAINTQTGNVVWMQTLSGDTFSVAPLVITNTLSGNLVIAATASGKLNVYNAGTGQPLQSIALGAGATGGMGFSEGLLVVPSGNNLVGLR
jgi:outer membrane protein assembly factor BamB